MALERKTLNAKVQVSGTMNVSKNEAEALESGDNETVLPELSMAKMLRCRVRYFTDGAVIGSKEFVDEAFAGARERFSEKRKDGARRMKGNGSAAAGDAVEYEGFAGGYGLNAWILLPGGCETQLQRPAPRRRQLRGFSCSGRGRPLGLKARDSPAPLRFAVGGRAFFRVGWWRLRRGGRR